MDQSETSRLESELQAIVERELPRDMDEIYGLGVKTRVIAFREGSVILFFGAVMSAVGIFSSYNDFFESISLIKKHCRMLVDHLVKDRHGSDWQVQVEVEYPTVPEPRDLMPWRRLRHMFGPEADDVLQFSSWMQPPTGRSSRRDGFFWFLLLLNVLLVVAVALLVSAAVRRVYFP
jgi:hypothetical protein